MRILETIQINGKAIDIIARKHYSAGFQIVLAQWQKGGETEYITWLYNEETKGFTCGHYFKSQASAYRDFI